MLWLVLRALCGVVILALAGFRCGVCNANCLSDTCQRKEPPGISLLGGLGIFSLALFLIGQIFFSRTIIGIAAGAAVFLSVRPLWRVWRKLSLSRQSMPREAFI